MSEKIQWLVEPKDANTNEVIARFLSQQGDGSGCDIITEDNLGNPLEGWTVDYSFITLLVSSTAQFRLKFNVYAKKGKGPYTQSTFHLLKRKSVNVNKAEEELKKISSSKKASG